MGAGSNNEVLIVVKSKEQAGNFKKTKGDVEGLHRSVLKSSIGFKAFGGFFRSAVSTVTAAGVVGFAAVTAEVVKATKGWADHEAIVRDTANTIKSTGGAAKVTTAQVSDLADAIERKTTKDGDAVQSGLNMLLTFKDIRNEVGKGNDIFNQAGSILTDMTAKMNQGSVTNETMSQSAIQLGKALNDPIAGVGALSRVGVTFTEGQKKQIETLVKSGHTMEAQKIILGELKSEFAGAAKASAKPWDGVVVVLRQVEDAIGKFVLPKVQAISNWALNKGLPALGRLKKEWDHNKDAIKALADIIVGQFTPAGGQAKTTLDGLRNATEHVEVSFDNLLIAVLGMVKHWLEFEEKTLHAQFAIENLGIAVGLAINVIDRMSGGSGHAADGVVAAFREMKVGTQQQLDKIKGDIRSAQGKIDSLHGRVIEIQARDRASAVIQHIKAQMNSMPGVQVSTILYGGRYQHGTMFVPQTGPAMVHKGEIVVPPDESEQIRRGRAVFGARGAMGVDHAAGATGVGHAGMVAAGGGGGTVVLEIHSGGSRLDDLLVEVLRKSIRSRGGDVQVVLGT